MISPEIKRDILSNVINLASIPENTEKCDHILYQLLLEDTNNGKLYKYRTFDSKGYSLQNLAEGTLHCSKLSEFNDPFDCKIGILFSSLLRK